MMARSPGLVALVWGVCAWWLALGAGCASQPLPFEGRARQERNERIYNRAVEVVEKRFFDATFGGRDWSAMAARYRSDALAATSDELLYRVLNDLFGELDVSHLGAMTPTEVLEMDTGRRARLGLQWHRFEEGWVIEEVLPGSPAEEAGLQRGWLLVEINGAAPEKGLRFRAEPGQKVTLTCRDNANTLRTVTMTARIIKVDTIRRERILAGGVVCLRFDEFDREARRWLSDALKRHVDAPGVVLDLRRNHGGQLFSLDIVVGELFPRPVATGRFVSREGDVQQGRARQWQAARYAGPLVVLVDDSTYSAGEILAHVLQHHRRAVLVGRKTGGAVIASRYYRLPGGGRLSVPVIDYIGLDGRRLEGAGVEPDVKVERSLAALRSGRDPDLEEAVKRLAAQAP